ncbi:pyridoxal-dependent decarboxylase, exosortase A system-associated [Sphingomonas sp. 28-63-12]|uniref:pyridoxal-dependent decarboxylase, exosortase A system-associated n=1 Tax=Sphingomonas sp. 28-63-12 TaxID=1970434 RepID=UPI000BD59C1F|nr:MAG: pyridoxal-dependent decarboxylase, exosortase A system-associated [Sphingomonas sp. 28-63-12]
MKPMGPIPQAFAAQTGMLVIAGKTVEQWADIAGDTPFFIYDFAMVAARITRLRAALPVGVGIHYAVKANPFAPLIRAIAPMIDGLDIASAGELSLVSTEAPGKPVSFAGPGKRDDELAAAISAGVTINLESEGETRRALAIGEKLGVAPRLAVRVNPSFELRGSGMRMGGRASPFGVDAEAVPGLVAMIIANGAEWRGLHIFAGSQTLNTGAIIEMQAATLALAGELADSIGAAPPLVNLGGGFGIPYFPGDEPVDVEAIGIALNDGLASKSNALAQTSFVVELGRWLVGDCGVYLTRVVDRKVSRGETFLITDGGLHHQLAASGNFGTVVKRNYPVAVAGLMGATAVETATIVGCLCTPLDRLADQVELPVATAGDLIAIFMAGAYGLSASPTAFLGHALPTELLAGLRDNPNAIFTS